MTIRKRLTSWYAALLTVIIVFFATTTYMVMRVTMLSDIDSDLTETATLITRNSRVYPATSDTSPSRINIELASIDALRAPGVYVQAWETLDGESVFKAASLTAEGLGTTPLDVAALNVTHDTIHSVEVMGMSMRVLTKPLTASGGGSHIIGYIQVAVRLDQLHQASDTLFGIMVISVIVAIFGALMLSLWFSHSALKPIEDITTAAASIANTNDLSTRLVWHGPNDELGQLTSVFNQMMRRIEHLFSVQQRFVADISHELRTPLTVIQGNIELMKKYGLDELSMEALESETHRMSRLVNDLLMLARADYGESKLERHMVDLDTVLADAFMQCQVLGANRDLNFRLTHLEPVRVYAEPDRLKQVIYNLVGNAIKFTPDGGEITVGLEHINQHAVLWVKDTGIGITEEDKLRVFDRFYQSEASRHHDTGEGFGLGLSIAKWIVEAHDGTIGVSSRPGQGTTFTVILPAYMPEDELGVDTPHSRATRPRIPVMKRENRMLGIVSGTPEHPTPHPHEIEKP